MKILIGILFSLGLHSALAYEPFEEHVIVTAMGESDSSEVSFLNFHANALARKKAQEDLMKNLKTACNAINQIDLAYTHRVTAHRVGETNQIQYNNDKDVSTMYATADAHCYFTVEVLE